MMGNKLVETPQPSGTMIKVRGEFGLPSAAFAAKDAYLAAYNPAGYGTLLVVRRDVASEFWVVEGSRAASCE